MKTLKHSILALFCAGLLIGTTSCNRGTGCGSFGSTKSKGPYPYASYKQSMKNRY